MVNNIDLDRLPGHIAFIMDGNGRWAKSKKLPRKAGHKAGADSLKKLVDGADKLGIQCITVYAFSTENWDRPKEEVDYLMELMEDFLDENIENAKKNNYKLRVIGDSTKLRADLVAKINSMEALTAGKTGLLLAIAISYGGRDEIVRATKKLCGQVLKGSLSVEAIDESLFERYLDTRDMPSPDLVIRTSGEMRLSNFLIWQTAYSEVYYSDKYWPDFNIDDLKDAIFDFQTRDRRFGKV